MSSRPQSEDAAWDEKVPPQIEIQLPSSRLSLASIIYPVGGLESLADDERDVDVERRGVESSGDASTCKKADGTASAGPNDAANPQNWARRKKWINTVVVSLFCFISPLSSTILAAALPELRAVLHVSSEVELQAIFSVFNVGYALGPLLVAPIADLHGHVLMLQVSNLVFLAANTASVAASSGTAMIILRLLAGMGGSAPLVLGGGMIGTMFKPEERGAAVAVYSLAPITGPTLGPIVGAVLAQHASTAYLFIVPSIASVIVAAAALFLLHETNPRVLLRRRTKAPLSRSQYYQSLAVAVRRPFRILFTQPMAALLAVYQALLMGLLYLVFSIYITIFLTVYRQPIDTASLNYLSLLVGSLLGTQLTGMAADVIYRTLKARNGGVGKPEFRLPLLAAGTVVFALGLCGLGWAAQYAVSFLVADVGAVFFATGNIITYQALQTLMIDTYAQHALSVLAAATLVRSMANFAFPLFAPALFRGLGLGWGFTLIGFITIIIGAVVMIAIWKFGKYLKRPLPANF